MKKILLAPFLLASMFSFDGELKANPRYSNSTPTPTASAERWYLVTIATNQRKTFQGYSPCPLRSYWTFGGDTGLEKLKGETKKQICAVQHNHSFDFSDWIDTEQTPVQPSNIAFKSLRECNTQARVIKDFYESYRYNQAFHKHGHYISDGPGGWGKKPNLWYLTWNSWQDHHHTTPNISTRRFNFEHKCIKGTVDY